MTSTVVYVAPTVADDIDKLLNGYAFDTVTLAPDDESDDLDDLDLDFMMRESHMLQQYEKGTHEFEKVDWDEIAAAGWTLDKPADEEESLTPTSNNKEGTARRRLNEEERLRKYSWERHKLPTPNKKRVRYTYTNTRDGSIVTSRREALRSCRAATV